MLKGTIHKQVLHGLMALLLIGMGGFGSCIIPPSSAPYCLPDYGDGLLSGGCDMGDQINGVSIFGENNTQINNQNSGCSNSIFGYGQFSNNLGPVELYRGATYTVVVSTNATGATNQYVKAWVDWDQSYTFSASEEIGNFQYGSSGVDSITFTVPQNASLDTTRLRIRQVKGIGSAVNIDPCFHYDEGEAEDYRVRIVGRPNDAGVDQLVAPEITGNFCSITDQEIKVRLRNYGSNAVDQVTVNWSANGMMQPAQNISLTPSLAVAPNSGSTQTVSIGTYHFPYQTPVVLKIWTSSPNGQLDPDNANDTLTVTVTSQKQQPVIKLHPKDTSICEGESVVLNAGLQPTGFTYSWTTGAQTQSISVNASGSYGVTVRSIEGCRESDTANVMVHPAPSVGEFGAVDHGNGNFVFTPTRMLNINLFHWDFGDGTTLTVPSDAPVAHHYNAPGTYPVTLTVEGSCRDVVLRKQIYVRNPTGISDVELNAGVHLYPNPSKSKVQISLDQKQDYLMQVSIYDAKGAKINQIDLDGQKAEVDISSLPSGLYQFKIQTNQGVVNKKVNVLH